MLDRGYEEFDEALGHEAMTGGVGVNAFAEEVGVIGPACFGELGDKQVGDLVLLGVGAQLLAVEAYALAFLSVTGEVLAFWIITAGVGIAIDWEDYSEPGSLSPGSGAHFGEMSYVFIGIRTGLDEVRK